jgi:SSS family solute:Na+ symporter
MQFVNWILGCVLIYASLFGIGKLIFQQWVAGALWTAAAVIAMLLISRNLSRADWHESTET